MSEIKAPSVIWFVFMWLIAFGSLLITTSNPLNCLLTPANTIECNGFAAQDPIVFFIATIIVPLLIATAASNIHGQNFKELVGFVGGYANNTGLVLITIGVTIIIVILIVMPMSVMAIGTPLYAAILWNTSILSTSTNIIRVNIVVIIALYLMVGFGEEILKIFGWKTIAATLEDKANLQIVPSIAIGMMISIFMWALLHIFAHPDIVSLLGLGLTTVWTLIWYGVFWVFGERLVSPSPGLQAKYMLIAGPIAGHATYDILLEFNYQGILTSAGFPLYILFGVIIAIIGGAILAYQYFARYPRLTWYT